MFAVQANHLHSECRTTGYRMAGFEITDEGSPNR